MGRKYKAPQENCYWTFCFTLSLSIAENNGKHLGKSIFQCSKRTQFQFLLSLSAHQGVALGVTKHVTNNIPPKIPGYGTVIVIRQTGFFIARSRICEFSSNKLVSTSPYELDSAGGSFWCFLTWTSAEVIFFLT